MKRQVLLAAFCLCFALVSAGTSYGETANKDELLKALKSRDVDHIVSTLNKIKRSRYQGGVLPLLKAIWNNDTNKSSAVPSEVLQLDIVRINVADVLVQANKNGITDAPMTAIHSYARNLLKSGDKEVVAGAVFVLAQIDNANDAALLGHIALNESDYLFRSAVIALSVMCSSAAAEELTRIEGAVSAGRAEFVRDTRAMFQGTGHCADRRANRVLARSKRRALLAKTKKPSHGFAPVTRSNQLPFVTDERLRS